MRHAICGAWDAIRLGLNRLVCIHVIGVFYGQQGLRMCHVRIQ